MSRLHEHAHRVIYEGDREAARYVLRCYADRKGWTDETFRARWDGVSALLIWWDALDPTSRPPLGALDGDDARAFLTELEARGLARTTIRGYRSGARALVCALHNFGTLPTGTVDPFKDVALLPPKRIYQLNPALLSQQKPLTALRLELLVALLNLGMSIPEICACRRFDFEFKYRRLFGYKKRSVKLGATAMAACTKRIDATPSLNERTWLRLLGWNADTARRYLNEVGKTENKFKASQPIRSDLRIDRIRKP